MGENNDGTGLAEGMLTSWSGKESYANKLNQGAFDSHQSMDSKGNTQTMDSTV